jgi:cyclopropane-fatty-acyl-phospholipid synthase
MLFQLGRKDGSVMTASVQGYKTIPFSAVFQGYDGPAFAIRRWDGGYWCSSAREKPVCTFVLQNPKALEALIAAPNELTLGEAFIHGDLDVEGDFFSAFSVAEHLFNHPRSLGQQMTEKLTGTAFGLWQRFKHGPLHSRGRDRSSISYHYDQPVAFFEPWLGKSLVYSCAYFHEADDPLEVAQEQKLELVCTKLGLQRSERFLDIGCGWGSLILQAACRHGAEAHGITLSKEQAETAKRRIEQAALEHCCSVELRDYRELEGTQRQFDKIASIGMFEHVGLKNLPRYFGIAHRLLKPGGLFLNHGISRSSLSPGRHNSFVDRYVFPDGRLVTLSEALSAAESQGLEVRDVENLREHYDLTLQSWLEGLRRNADTLLQHVPEITYRIWLLYTAGSAAAFRRGDIGVYQVLFSRPDEAKNHLPLTRRDWYSKSASTRRESAF